jgi:hypothetical protein
VDRDTFNQLSHQQTTTEGDLLSRNTNLTHTVIVNTSRRHHSEVVSQKATTRAITTGMEDCITARNNQAQQNKLHHYISTTKTLQESAVRLLTTPAN